MNIKVRKFQSGQWSTILPTGQPINGSSGLIVVDEDPDDDMRLTQWIDQLIREIDQRTTGDTDG